MSEPGRRQPTSHTNVAALSRLREQRIRPMRARPVGDDFKALQAELARDARRFGSVGALWSDCCPPDLVERTRVAGFERGVLHIEAADTSTRYALDQALRGGLRERIVQGSGSAVRRIRVDLPR